MNGKLALQNSSSLNVADAKKSFSELLGRVAYGGETITILKRGRPMARLVPVTAPPRTSLADVKGWLDEGDRFFTAMEEILRARHTGRPRRLPQIKG